MFKNVFTHIVISLAWTFAASAQTANPSKDNLVTVDPHKGNFMQVDPAADWSSYQRIVLVPASYEPANPSHTLKPRQVDKLRAAVDSSLQKAIPGNTGSTGPALEVRPVITDVRRANPYVNAASFAAIQAPISYGGASLRFELVDAGTGELIGEITSKRCAGPWNVYPWQMLEAFEPVGHASNMLKRDARLLRKDLERLSRLQPTPTAPAQSSGSLQ